MKILHTSDWHLGQKFISKEREQEHALALDWLAGTIAQHAVDALVVAGDVFDIANPPSSARALYFGFLKKLLQTNCRHAVITGGNHDSPQMLEAPKEILELLNVHVVGKAADPPADGLILLKSGTGTIEAIVAAVPFLRDQDLKRAVAGETSQDRSEKIREGILAYYEAMAEAAEAHTGLDFPILATGHLCVTGHETSHKQDNIYLGNIENIRAGQFPDVFAYIALGHIHRPQFIESKNVRYSGSLIPLSFSETKDVKSVTIVDFVGPDIRTIEVVEAPVFRRLKTITGSYDYVQERLEKLHNDYEEGLAPWVEVMVETDVLIPNLSGKLYDFAKDFHLEILKIRQSTVRSSLTEQLDNIELEDLTPMDVFQKKLETVGRSPEEKENLLATFRELEEWVASKD